MLKTDADFDFTPDAPVQNGVALSLRMRRLDGGGSAVAQIRGAKEGGRGGGCHQAVQLEIVKPVPGV
jgi:hypothetical protein